MSADPIIDRLRAHWRSKGIRVRPGAAESEINAFEARRGVRLTRELRDYFLTVDGMEPGDSDEWITQFTALGQLESLREILRYSNGRPYAVVKSLGADADRILVLVDVMISSNLLVVHLSPDPADAAPLQWTDGEKVSPFMPSFTEFLEQYLADPDTVLKVY